MSDRPPLLPLLFDPFVREPEEITDSEETFYPTQETPQAAESNRRLPDGSDDDEEEQEVLPSEEEELVDEAGRNARLYQDRPEQVGDQRPGKLEREDEGTPPANATVDKQEETPQKVDTKSDMKNGSKRSASIVDGPKDEKRSVRPATTNEVPQHEHPEGNSTMTRGEKQGK